VALLRERLLGGRPEAYGVSTNASAWAALMETGYENGAGIVIARADGAADLYLSVGGGVTGGRDVPRVNAAARRMVELASAELAQLALTRAFPLPARGEVQLLVLTRDGVRGARASQAALASGKHSLSRLFLSGHELLTALREESEARGIEP